MAEAALSLPEPPAIAPQSPAKRPLPQALAAFQFTTANAAAMARRRYELEAQRKAEAIAKAQAAAQAPVPAVDEYTAKRCARVRAQLDRIDDLLIEEDDPQQIERLSRAACALSRELAKLLGIPDPGSLKPSSKPTKESRGPSSYLADEPLVALPTPPAAYGQ